MSKIKVYDSKNEDRLLGEYKMFDLPAGDQVEVILRPGDQRYVNPVRRCRWSAASGQINFKRILFSVRWASENYEHTGSSPFSRVITRREKMFLTTEASLEDLRKIDRFTIAGVDEDDLDFL